MDKDIEAIKLELKKQLNEMTVDGIELLIDFKIAAMLEELSKRLEVLKNK